MFVCQRISGNPLGTVNSHREALGAAATTRLYHLDTPDSVLSHSELRIRASA